jgi:hypothetical protein
MSRYIVTDIDQANSHLAHLLSIMGSIQFNLSAGERDDRLESLLWIARDIAEGIVAGHDAGDAIGHPGDLSVLTYEHDTALEAYDSVDVSSSAVDSILDKTRQAILDHRPRSLEEAARKGSYMRRTRSFSEWDDFDRCLLIDALTPKVAS